jgi:isochorismate synthase
VSTAGRLVLRTERAGPAFDLVAEYPRAAPSFLFERRGIGACGATGRPLELDGGTDRFEVASERSIELLRSIQGPTTGPGTIVAGAFPFQPEPPRIGLLTDGVRRVCGGATVRLRLGGPDGPLEHEGSSGSDEHASAPRGAFEGTRLQVHPTRAAYAEAVAGAVHRIRDGDLGKVVLARTVDLDAGRPLEPGTLLRHLRAVDPDCYTFATPVASGASLIGASPELLLERRGSQVSSTPLAGSAPRHGDPVDDRAAAEALLGSTKDREEHAFVAEAIAETLGPLCDELSVPKEPQLIGTANVWHLATPIVGRLRDPALTAIQLVGLLHPTPAVGGSPRDAALAAIADLEPFDRGWYAGPIGWMDADGDGAWAIALRCAELRGSTARLYAGAGIVADSDPASELDETERKLRAFLDALRWG